jgi:hypothetical protein
LEGGGMINKGSFISIKMAIFIVLFLYLTSVLIRSELKEREVENFISTALVSFAKPWDYRSLQKISSWWLLEKSNLKPSDIVEMARQDYGNLIEISRRPDCVLNKGFDKYSDEERTYAICSVNLKMERKNILMKIRMIQENGSWVINDFISVN